MSDDEHPSPRLRQARVFSPPRLPPATPDSILRLLADLNLNPGEPSPDATGSSSVASVAALAAVPPSSDGGSDAATASTLDVPARSSASSSLHDPFGPDELSDLAVASSALSASELFVGASDSSTRALFNDDDVAQSHAEGSVAWTDELASDNIERCARLALSSAATAH